MNLLENSAEIWTDVLEKIGRAWWVEIITKSPSCIYYFGPFPNANTALLAQSGYIEDLEQESPEEIAVNIKRCQPQKLTIVNDSEPECI
jgi:Domain of unknown function (DUF1816)